MLLRRRRGSVRPRARRGRLRRWSRAGGRARKASAPILACGAPGGVPSRAPGEGCCPPWPSAKKLSRARRVWQIDRTQLAPPGGLPEIASTRKNLARMMTVPLRAAKRLAQHTARVRAAGFRASRRVRRVRDATPCPRRAVSPRGARRRFPPRRTRQSRTRHLVFFVILCACPGSSRERKRGGETRGPREPAPSSLTRPSSPPPPAPPPPRAPPRAVPPAVARAPSSRAPRPSAAAPPRPRARANAHRKTDGSSAKTPSQRRGSRAMAPRGGRACPAENAEWNPTRGNL